MTDSNENVTAPKSKSRDIQIPQFKLKLNQDLNLNVYRSMPKLDVSWPGPQEQCDSVMTRGQQAHVSMLARCEELESFKNLSFGAAAMVSPLGLIHLDFPVFTNKLVPRYQFPSSGV